jgi:large subunit ribosomal protein L20
MRVKTNVASKKSKRRFFRDAKGFYGGRRRLIRTVKESVVRARAYSYRGRKIKKRDYRSLWIIRLNAAAQMHGLRYSQLIHGLTLINCSLNRKSLSELAIHSPAIFGEVIGLVKAALEKKASNN